MKNIISWFKNEESGQGMVEYALIIALISIVAIVIITALGGKIKAIFTNANSQL